MNNTFLQETAAMRGGTIDLQRCRLQSAVPIRRSNSLYLQKSLPLAKLLKSLKDQMMVSIFNNKLFNKAYAYVYSYIF